MMMQCPRCRTILPNDAADTLYCSNCGAPLAEVAPFAPTAVGADPDALPTVQEGGWQENAPATPPLSTVQQVAANKATMPAAPLAAPVSGAPSMESGWAEFSGVAVPMGMPASSGTSYPPVSPVPGGYAPPSAYPYAPGTVPPAPGSYSSPGAYSYMPGYMPPTMPAPKRRSPVLAIILSILVLLLIFGGVFVGITIGQSHNGSSPAHASTTTSPTPSPDQLYQQVTSQNPAFVDSLQDTSLSKWTVSEQPLYGCEIKSDGLHMHEKHTGHFSYCTSGRGKFSNFAFQIDMKILAGDGGGLIFRGDTAAGNTYYFLIKPDGNYLVYIEQNHQSTTTLHAGITKTFSAGIGQKNTLTVIAQGEQLFFYVNQKFLTSIHDSTYTTGYLGVLANDHVSPTEVVYTNAKVWTL